MSAIFAFTLSVQVVEDVASLAQVNQVDGIDSGEAVVIAREFFHHYVSACGKLAAGRETEDAFEFQSYLGKEGKPAAHPIVVNKISGDVSMVEFSIPLKYTDIWQEPLLEEILGRCEVMGDEDVLAWEPWLQRERSARIYCPSTDYYTLLLDEEDYPPEARSLAAHQIFDYCKYGNPATIFVVLTTEKAAKQEACAQEQMAMVREGSAYDLQELPSLASLAAPHKRFKIVSPHFAAVVYTTVYDVDAYNYWVDRSYEVLRQAEYSAVDCICPVGCSSEEEMPDQD